ncbi:holo-ACP synthase [Cryobacterium melibiosiphilum]|uniref:Holo-[acyl-carrier-protein] synthase n=1 Tax=Cryobacterium melibiosiphilum TaxID=995039 RepID=A0A3A5MTP0_9MICO|nr:holo-ACP synthase [Cryobacterium melibiosiphilum]RJT90518.1 holo-ACP synthase [Cryobacterium melibiosiphilum]
MIVGIGVDVVDLARFGRQVDRTPALIPRLFAESERGLAVHSLAARFAAKEALVKALGHSGTLTWRDMEIVSDVHGNPGFVVDGPLAAVLAARGIDRVHVTMTHDAGVACAFVVAEADR